MRYCLRNEGVDSGFCPEIFDIAAQSARRGGAGHVFRNNSERSRLCSII